MPIEMQRMPGEPILIVTITGRISTEDLLGIFQQTVEYSQEFEGQIYRITHVYDFEASFEEIQERVKLGSEPVHGSTSDPNTTVVLVGNNHWLKMYRDGMRHAQHGAIDIPTFEDLDSALEHVRFLIKMEHRSK